MRLLGKAFARVLAASSLALLAFAVPARAATTLSVQQVATGLTRPVFVTSPPGDPRLFIVEQRGTDNKGRIKIVKNGVLLPTPFLTTATLPGGNEQGLLGLAFPPDFATSGVFYVNYTLGGLTGDTRIARHRVSVANPDRADSLGEVFLTVPQPFSNHNAGWMDFGPDGYLWIPLGDGGDGGDPGDRAQNINNLLGKILRLDVSGATGYAIPPDNPYVGIAGLDEIWAVGLRNPYRCSFDRLTHDLILGDVGQFTYEEIDFSPYPNLGRKANYGWRCWEGNHVYGAGTSPNTPCTSCAQTACFTFPAYEYDHSLGRCSVTGGYVYRGCAIPDLRGTYFFSDYCGAQIYSGKFTGGLLTSVADRRAELAAGTGYTLNTVVGFGEDAQGELYFCDLGGQVYKIVPRTFVAEADMPSLRVTAASGDTLGATGSGNALLPGVTAFADPGGRIAGVGFLRNARLRGCETAAGNCLTVPLRLSTWDIDVTTCVDPDSSELTRTFVFTNRAATAQPLDFRDVIAPWLDGTDDVAATAEPAPGPDESARLVLYDAVAPTRFVTYRGFAPGATITQDVHTKTAVEARIAADEALVGDSGAMPGRLALAFGFDFGAVAPGAAESVVVVVRILPTSPLDAGPAPAASRLALGAAGAMPFRATLSFALELPETGEVGLAVYDGRGRRVRALHTGAMAAGRHVLAWDGRDDRGVDQPAGLYFVRATTARGERSLRAVRVR